MRALVIDDQARSKARQVRVFAEQPENWYGIDGADSQPKIPGNDPRYIVHVNTYRCVFSITKAPDGSYRRLSVSAPAHGLFPNPYTAFTIAELFGFEGWDSKTLTPGPDWSIQANYAEHCVVFACPYSPEAKRS